MPDNKDIAPYHHPATAIGKSQDPIGALREIRLNSYPMPGTHFPNNFFCSWRQRIGKGG